MQVYHVHTEITVGGLWSVLAPYNLALEIQHRLVFVESEDLLLPNTIQHFLVWLSLASFLSFVGRRPYLRRYIEQRIIALGFIEFSVLLVVSKGLDALLQSKDVPHDFLDTKRRG